MLWTTCTTGKIICPFIKCSMMALKWFSLKILGSAANERVANIDVYWVFRKATFLNIFFGHKLNLVHVFSQSSYDIWHSF